MPRPTQCDNCGREIGPDDIVYWVRLEIFASPEPPELSLEDLDRDYKADMEKIIDQMEGLDPKEAEAQVYEAYRFYICTKCRRYFHDHLKHRKSELS
jgi:hypothetical protein